ncbi:MAG: exodeoxyribonuclease VII large subunit, partial [Ilumatobacteraceae bacterium]
MSVDEFDDEWDDEFVVDDVDDQTSEASTYSVSELAGTINDVLEESFDDGVWVWGEITGISNKGG